MSFLFLTSVGLISLDVGAMFRSNYGVTANVGVNLSETLTLGYAYDFSTNTYGSSFGASHEFMLTYRFGSNKENERLQNEMKRLKLEQRRSREQNEELVDEKLKEFKDNYKAEMAKALEEEKQKMQAELERLRQQAQEAANNAANNSQNNMNTNRNNTNNTGNQGGTTMQDLENQRNNNMNNNAGNTGGQMNNTNANQGGYNSSNMASNVTPGSPGYYVTAGVFGQKANADRLMNRLQSQGLDARVFQDASNNFFYVYLLKFNSYQEADQAKTSNLNGRYTGDLWIKIVK